MADARYPSLHLNQWQPTRDMLHLYSAVISRVRRDLSDPLPRWGHISLFPRPDGLTTGAMRIPGGGGATLEIRLDLVNHLTILETSSGELRYIPLTEGLNQRDFAVRVRDTIWDMDVDWNVEVEVFDDSRMFVYDPAMAQRFAHVLDNVVQVLWHMKKEIEGETSPVQFWSHHFDLSMEWFSDKRVTQEENGETSEVNAQLGFGFGTGDGFINDSYFYINPWPFDAGMTSLPLPEGAYWFTDGFNGAVMPYAMLEDGGTAELLGFCRKVYEIVAPLLR